VQALEAASAQGREIVRAANAALRRPELPADPIGKKKKKKAPDRRRLGPAGPRATPGPGRAPRSIPARGRSTPGRPIGAAHPAHLDSSARPASLPALAQVARPQTVSGVQRAASAYLLFLCFVPRQTVKRAGIDRFPLSIERSLV
jgi:hypothetical protein